MDNLKSTFEKQKNMVDEISDIMSSAVTQLIEVADSYGIERNIVVKAASQTFLEMAFITDFIKYKMAKKYH